METCSYQAVLWIKSPLQETVRLGLILSWVEILEEGSTQAGSPDNPRTEVSRGQNHP